MDTARDLAARLTAWFEGSRRDLPWRTDRTPYRVWLSEVMLQQTRVAVVEAYFRRFMERFPDVKSLAAASEDDVLSLWSGLGYYSRGRNLHKAARAVVDDHGGSFPTTSQALRTLPGVGAYTAAAVASFAFGEPIAVVDGNVNRVIARFTGERSAVDTAPVQERIRAHAQGLVDASDGPGAQVNEALMELGALVCTPRSPQCGACPWSSSCVGYRDKSAASLPVKSPKRARKKLHVASVVVVDARGRVWLERRGSKGLFGGLFEPPSVVLVDGDARAAWRALLKSRGLPIPKRMPKAVLVERTLTHRELTFSVARVDVAGVGGVGDSASASFIDDVSAVGVSSAVRAVLAAVGAQRDATRGVADELNGSEPYATNSSAVVLAGTLPTAVRK